MRRISQTKLINILLIVGFAILTFYGILAYNKIQKLVKLNQWATHTHQVIEAANVTLLSLLDAESRLNYYALTNNKTKIADLPKLIDNATTKFDQLKKLVADNPIQQVRVNELQPLVDEKINTMKKIISFDNEVNRSSILQLILNPRRQELKIEITKKIGELNQEEEYLLANRNALIIQEINSSNVSFIIFGTLSGLFIILSYMLLNYNLYRRNLAEQRQTEIERNLLVTNQNLHISEERYALAIEGSASGLWDWEIGTDHVFYSPYFKKMLGYSDAEFPNTLQSFERIIHPNDHNRLWELIDQHLYKTKNVSFKTEYRLKAKSGEYRWIQAGGQALWNEAGEPIRMSGSIIDITERKTAEQRLRIQHTISESLSAAGTLDEVSVTIITKICEELGWELGIIWMVDEDQNLLKCIGSWHQPSAYLKKFGTILCQNHISYGNDLLGEVWKTGKPIWVMSVSQESRYPSLKIAKEHGLKTCAAFPILVQKKVVGIMEFFMQEEEQPTHHLFDLMSITASQIGQFLYRQLTEHELRETETQKTAILESVTDSIISFNEDKDIILFNPQTIKEFNYQAEELQGKNIELLLPGLHTQLESLLSNSIIEFLAKRKNGDNFPVEIKMSTVYFDNQKMYVLSVRNITERKKVEKMKNEFVSVVSHELRTPLTSIRGALGLVLGGAVGTIPDKVNNLLALANNNCERLLLLINDILDIEKLEAGKMNFDFKTINLDQLVNESISANKMFADKYNVKLVLGYSEPNLEVNVDPDRLMQVLTNLISNAVKFSPKDDQVIITIKKHEDNARVLISNKGPGIPLDFQNRMFQKFSQVDTSDTRGKGGTGLGLNISKAIIEKLGGSINFISKPNEITTFFFDLPLWHETQKHLHEEVQEAAEKNRERILLCEDDEDQANYLAKVLENANYMVDISHNVIEAKKFLQKNNYHALLLDLILPDQDGITFIRELRSKPETQELPIIVLSIIAETGRNLLRGEAFPVLDWLDKPIDFGKLIKVISQIKRKTHPKIPSILYVEDDLSTFENVRILLEKEAQVYSAKTIKEAIITLKKQKFDLVLLDLMLPDGNAARLLPLIREYRLPVIIYSALELDKNISKTVKHALVKANTTNTQLLNIVNQVLRDNT